MMERYFIHPKTVDRIRRSWLGEAIEGYVTWLSKEHYATRCVHHRVPLLLRFAEFCRRRDAVRIEELGQHLDAFVASQLRRRSHPCRSKIRRRQYVREIRGPIKQFLRVLQVGAHSGAREPRPFAEWAPGFFAHLRDERGLRAATIESYAYQLTLFEQFLQRRGIPEPTLSLPLLDAFLAQRSLRVSARSLGTTCAAVRALLRFMFREGVLRRDLSVGLEGPRTYSLSDIPRSVRSEDVDRMLAMIDRRSVAGKRDYAMLLLLVTYGLRAREVAALVLDDLDWSGSVLHVRGRKAGHAAAYPLVVPIGEALLDYLRHGRPETADRHVFLRVCAPRAPVTHRIVSGRAKHYLLHAGIDVHRPGSHTLRHSCAQRLVDAEFSLKVIGDYLGHRHPASTRIYSKVAIEALREVAIGDGEQLL